jgi:iron(III) transport system permease protein
MKSWKSFFGISSMFWILLILFVFTEAFMRLFAAPSELWDHIFQFVLSDVIINTLLLVLLSSFLASVIGFLAAYIVIAYDFKGRKIFSFLLYLPLAIPPYIATYIYSHMLGYTGIIQTFFRNQLNISFDPAWFTYSSMQMGVFVFTITLFPYVYITAKGFMQKYLGNYIETARTLQRGHLNILMTIALPLAAPAVFAGFTLIALEILSDFGVVMYLGIPAFSTAIYRSWISLGDFDSALRLSAVLMIFVIAILLLQHLLRKSGFVGMSMRIRPLKRIRLSGISEAVIMGLLGTLLMVSLIVPIGQLLLWSSISYANIRWNHFGQMVVNTLTLSMFVSIAIIMIALLIANYTRLSRSWLAVISSKLTLLGYSIPGSVVAMLVIFFFITIKEVIPINTQTTLTMLVFGLILRYLGLGYQNIETGMRKIGRKFNEASQLLGKNYGQSFLQVDIPLLLPSLFAGFALVFIDVIKELPLTLNLRPFNYHTLATQVYQYASDERVVESAIPSLFIILISAILLGQVIRWIIKEDN